MPLAFATLNGSVIVTDGPYHYRLTDDQCERLLDIWQEAGATRLFLDLYDVHLKCGGVPRLSAREALRLSIQREEIRATASASEAA